MMPAHVLPIFGAVHFSQIVGAAPPLLGFASAARAAIATRAVTQGGNAGALHAPLARRDQAVAAAPQLNPYHALRAPTAPKVQNRVPPRALQGPTPTLPPPVFPALRVSSVSPVQANVARWAITAPRLAPHAPRDGTATRKGLSPPPIAATAAPTFLVLPGLPRAKPAPLASSVALGLGFVAQWAAGAPRSPSVATLASLVSTAPRRGPIAVPFAWIALRAGTETPRACPPILAPGPAARATTAPRAPQAPHRFSAPPASLAQPLASPPPHAPGIVTRGGTALRAAPPRIAPVLAALVTTAPRAPTVQRRLPATLVVTVPPRATASPPATGLAV